MTPRPLQRLALPLILGLLLLAPRPAHAEVIDYDPLQDDPIPEILSPDEMERWEALRGGVQRHSVRDISPDGSYALLSRGGFEILETDTLALRTLNFEPHQLVSALHWTSDSEAKALLRIDYENPDDLGPGDQAPRSDYFLGTIDFATGTISSDSVSMPDELSWSRTNGNASLRGGALLEGAGGRLYVVGLGSMSGGGFVEDEVLEIERRSYEAPEIEGQPEEPDLSGGVNAPLRIAQVGLDLIAVAMDDGTPYRIGEIPMGASTNRALNSVAGRPGHDTVAYVTSQPLPWTGENVNLRSARNGGMPNSYYNVQENLGRIPESENLHITRTTLHLVDLATGEGQAIPNAEHTPGQFQFPMWSANGEQLYVESNTPSMLEGREHPVYEYAAGVHLKRFSPAGEAQGEWTREGMDALNTGFTPLEGSQALVTYGMNTTRHLAVVDLSDPAVEPVPVYQGDDMLGGYAYRNGVLVASLYSAADPGETFVGKAGDDMLIDSFTPATDLNAELRALSNTAYETFEYETSAGYTLGGVYVYPAEWGGPPNEPQPMVVWQQGGPGGQMTNSWATSVESPYSMLPNFGIPVIIVNGSGRMSNGAQFYSDMADGNNYGQRDIQDVKEAVDHLVDLGWAKADAVGVTGCSYGGYFTLQSLVEHPNTYAAGNSQCSLNDMFYEFNFGWSPFLAYLLNGTPTGNPQEYAKDSPTYNANKIEVPLLQFHGTNDFLFFEQITNVHDQVKMNGVPSRFFRAIGYGHGLGTIRDVNTGQILDRQSGAKGQRFAFQLQLDWFRTHLGIQEDLAFDNEAVAEYMAARGPKFERRGDIRLPGPVVPEVR